MLRPVRRNAAYPAAWNAGLLHRSIDDLLEDFFGDTGADRQNAVVMPQFDVSETDDAVMIEAELPGIDEKDVQLTLQDNILTITGEKKKEEEKKKKNVYVCERSYGHFQRSLQLGSDIDADKVKASFKKGVLTVTVPKTESAKSQAKAIEIQSE